MAPNPSVNENAISHTPGPWQLWTSETDPGAFTIHGDSPHTVEGVTVGHMLIAGRVIGTAVGMEGVANAHLLAAAPELLAACRAVVAQDYGFVDHPAMSLCRAAVRKAEGTR